MTDRELLESAARAAGIEIFFDEDGDCYRVKESGNRRYWNPLAFDGDALRLARFLQMTVAHEPSRGGWSVGAIVNGEFKWLAHDDDQRRAIVLAAAAIGGGVS